MQTIYLFFSFCAGVIATLLFCVITRSSGKKLGKPADKPKQGDMHGYYVERSRLTNIEGTLFLRQSGGLCSSLRSVNAFLSSKMFRQKNPELIPVLEKAKAMMEAGEEGPVVL